MRKKTIAILFGIGFGISVISSIIIIGGIVAVSSAVASCNASAYCDTTAATSGFTATLLLGGLIALVGGVLTTIAWVAILVKQAQRQQWAWFICTLLFGGICMLIWLIIEPEVPVVPQYAVAYQPVRPGYPPYPTAGAPYPPEQPYYQNPYPPQ